MVRPLERDRTPARGQRGASSLEFAIHIALLVSFLLAILHVSVYFHFRTAAQAAARHGLDAVRVTQGTPEAAVATAEDFLAQAASSLRDPTVTATRSATTATVTVTGDVVPIFPGVHLTVEVTVDAPVERTT